MVLSGLPRCRVDSSRAKCFNAGNVCTDEGFGSCLAERCVRLPVLQLTLAKSFFPGGNLVVEKPSTVRPGPVQKIIKSTLPGEPEKAEIAVEGADDLYKEIRIENTLTGEDGRKVGLKKGAQVEVVIEADRKDTTPKQEPL